ncbi:MAG: hypothetical protein ISS55_11090 [Dehalococcoidales bacterium]|nr:hypothetical protein [Dehalococcoidales bacterium]
MIGAQQLGTVSPGQLTMVQPGQLATAPGVGVAQLGGIGEMITAIMPLIIIMMLMPILKGLGKER